MNINLFAVFSLSAVLTISESATIQAPVTNTTTAASGTIKANPSAAPNASNGIQNSNNNTPTPTVTTKQTTAAPTNCIKGTCSGSDDSCAKNITTTCSSTGSCTTQVETKGNITTVTLDCGVKSCPTVTTPSPSSTGTLTCCSAALCNKYQPQTPSKKSKASFSFSTNIFYSVSILLLAFFM